MGFRNDLHRQAFGDVTSKDLHADSGELSCRGERVGPVSLEGCATARLRFDSPLKVACAPLGKRGPQGRGPSGKKNHRGEEHSEGRPFGRPPGDLLEERDRSWGLTHMPFDPSPEMTWGRLETSGPAGAGPSEMYPQLGGRWECEDEVPSKNDAGDEGSARIGCLYGDRSTHPTLFPWPHRVLCGQRAMGVPAASTMVI